ncbi:SDR family NAD(P)-dependent oxidoreductase [Litorimonas sp. RW-G-Af-16]|uniref:SDR family NAD(P)-dependent oxidoreductase n=1 Tax=Litorimonas sp. RW-G-Af-16 TaxID=3241168 RepID=UPI00390C502B
MAGSPRRLKDCVALITGGGSGVGFECAKGYIAAGAKVLIVGRNEETLKSACKSLGRHSDYLAGTVTDPKFAQAAMAKAKSGFGKPVDILINNAGTILRKTAEATSDEDWAAVMSINVDGVFYFSRAFAQQAVGKGAIVNLSSTCGQVGAAGLAAYCASKGAVDQLTRAMALELAPRQITVNAVAPGAINSPMLFSKHTDPKLSETVIERNIESIPIGAVAEPEEVARAVMFLSQETHITGTILTVDGGYTAV